MSNDELQHEVGDIVIIDTEKAENFDPDWKIYTDVGRVEGQIKQKEGEYYYSVETIDTRTYYIFHVHDNHIIKNLTSPNYLCNEHEMDGLYHKKYDMEFCPFCGIDRKTKIKKHPISRKISKLWNPYEKPEDEEDIRSLADEADGIVLSAVPVMGILVAKDCYGFSKDNESNVKNMGNRYYQVMLIGIFIQSLWMMAILGIVGTIVS